MGDDETMIHARVAQILVADQGILDTFCMRVLRAQNGVCELQSTVPDALVNAAGFAHGSFAFSLLDTACAYALTSLEVRGVTVNANTTYVKAASAEDVITVKAEVISKSRRTASLRGEAYIQHETGTVLAAHGSFVFQLIEVRD